MCYSVTLVSYCSYFNILWWATCNYRRYGVRSKVYGNSMTARVSSTQPEVFQTVTHHILSIACYRITNSLLTTQESFSGISFYTEPIYIEELRRTAKGKVYHITITRVRASCYISNSWWSIVICRYQSRIRVITTSVRSGHSISTVWYVLKYVPRSGRSSSKYWRFSFYSCNGIFNTEL